MSRRSKAPKITAAAGLPDGVHEQLQDLASVFDTSVAALLRWGAMLVLERGGEEWPASIAHFRRVPFGGQVPRYARHVDRRAVRLSFDDRTFEALEAKAGDDHVAWFVHDLVERALCVPERSLN